MRFSTRSRRLENVTVPSVTVMRSIVGASEPAAFEAEAGLEGDGFGVAVRSRNSGTLRTGRTIASSDISGRPDHTLPSVMSAWMRPTVRRLPASRSFGGSSVTSFSVTFNDGHRPILVEPAIVSRYPVSRSTRSWIAEVRKPEGIPTISSSAAITMTAAMAPPAIFKAFMSIFQTGSQRGVWPGRCSGGAFSSSLSRKGETAQSR